MLWTTPYCVPARQNRRNKSKMSGLADLLADSAMEPARHRPQPPQPLFDETTRGLLAGSEHRNGTCEHLERGNGFPFKTKMSPRLGSRCSQHDLTSSSSPHLRHNSTRSSFDSTRHSSIDTPRHRSIDSSSSEWRRASDELDNESHPGSTANGNSVPTIVIDMPESPDKLDSPDGVSKSTNLLMEPEPADSTTTSIMSGMDNDRVTFNDEGVLSILKRGITFMKRKKDRLVDKNGACRIEYAKVSDRGQRFLIDFFTTMLEIKWRYHFLLFSLAFGTTWLVFAMVWWALVSADMYIHHNVTDYIPCVDGVTNFPTSLLFSIETQHTIGYGTRAITPSCPVATCLLMMQCMVGVILECILTGIIFAKMARPKRRAQTILFSDKAVICQRDGQRSLMFRVGDMRKSQILGATIHVMLAERKVTKEGEHLPIVTRDVPVTTETGSEYIFLAWPITIMHKIDEDSPLFNLSPLDLLEKDWEFIVVLEGTDEVTGATFQVLSSYLPSEILWGHHLKSLLSKSTGGVYTIDYTYFHETAQLNISNQSARRTAIFYSYEGNEKDDESLSDVSVR